jgi:hypothetical protein
MAKSLQSIGTVKVVPNSFAAKKVRTSKSSAAKELGLLEGAYKANAATKEYKIKRTESGWTVVVHEKGSGKVLSEMKVRPSAGSKPAVRKLSLRPKAGTVSIKRILDAV